MQAAAFAAGLLGGVHCAGMCGGIVAGLSASARGPALARQLAFNTGRIGSYAVAGAIAGAAGDWPLHAAPVLGAQLALLALANLLMLMLGLYIAGWSGAVLALERVGGRAWRHVQPFARRMLPISSTPRALAAGMAWGWVPCGLVYTMLFMALASGGALSGAGVMAAFGLGTLPTLLATGLAAQRVMAIRRVAWIRHAAGLAVIALALWGFLRLPGLREAALAGWHACIS